MPLYQYRCDRCGHEHEEFESITAKPLATCPECAFKSGYGRVLTVPNAIVRGVENAKTIGQAAEENARRVGKERLAEMAAADKARVRKGFKGKLPKGASLNTTATGAKPWWRDGDKPLDLKKVKNVKKFIEKGEAK